MKLVQSGKNRPRLEKPWLFLTVEGTAEEVASYEAKNMVWMARKKFGAENAIGFDSVAPTPISVGAGGRRRFTVTYKIRTAL